MLDGCEDFHRLIHPDTGIPLAQWDFDMIMVPHCVRYTQPAPPYDEFCRATQAVNPYLLIPDDLMAQIWKDVFECRVELGHTTREDADRVIAAVSQSLIRLEIQHHNAFPL